MELAENATPSQVLSQQDAPRNNLDSEGFQVPKETHYTPKNLLDLRLMHHYSVFTAKTFSGTFNEDVVKALQVDLPSLAFEHDFLLDAVLFAAMVHLGCSGTPVKSLPLFAYRDRALRALRGAIGNIPTANIHAVRGASVLLAAVSFPTDRITNQPGLWMSNWMALALGQRNFRAIPECEKSTPGEKNPISARGLYGSFSDLFAPAVVPHPIQPLLDRDGNAGEDSSYHYTLSTAAGELGRLISILETPFEPVFLEKQVKAWAFDVVPRDFLFFIQQERPEALVVLAYYLAVLKFLPRTWVYEDCPTHDIAVVASILGPAWKEHISLPERIIQMDDNIPAAKLLVSCLGGNVGSQ